VAKRTRILISALLALCLLPGLARAEDFDCTKNKCDYAVAAKIPATHTENGSVDYVCRPCGASYRQILYAIGHVWSDWSTQKAPTCARPGSMKRTCNVGTPHSESKEIPALGHKYEETAQPPTCTEDGKRVFTCSKCKDSYSETFGLAIGHSYTEAITKEAVCGREGAKTFTCGACGDSYSQPIAALSHIFGEWVEGSPAGEGVEGSRYRACALCGERVTQTIAALPVPLPPSVPGPVFGVVEIAVTAANIGAWVLLPLLLAGEFIYLTWEKKRKREILAAKRFASSGEDGYASV